MVKESLVQNSFNKRTFAKLLFILLLINTVSFYSRIFQAYILLVSAILVAIAILLIRRKGANNIRLKKPRKFVHVKCYISDNMAIKGSANLTYSGMHRNTESIDLIYDKGTVESLKKQFWKEWDAH